MCIFAAAAVPVAAAAVGSTAATGVGAAAASAAAAGAAGAAASASALTIGSLALTVLGAGLNFYGQRQQAEGQAAQATAAGKIASNNQKIAQWQADDAMKRGAEDELQNRRKYSQIAGSQRATFASRGIDIGEGSALAQLDDTAMFGNIDSNIIRENANREAWGFKNQGASYGADASMYKAAASGYRPLFGGASTLLTAAGDVADKWYQYKYRNQKTGAY